MHPYPPEYDLPEICEVCGVDCYDCDCPECGVCGTVGDATCYAKHGLKPAGDSIAAFCDHIGVSDELGQTLRQIDRHNTEHVWIVLPDDTRLYYHSKGLDEIPVGTRLKAVGVGGIAWDGSDWEYATEVPAGGNWSALDQARKDFEDALENRALSQN
jgi:hypothetical protein